LIPLVGFALVSYLVFQRGLLGRTDRFIGDALTAFASEVSAERRGAFETGEALRTTIAEVRFRDLAIIVLDPEGRAVINSPMADPALAREIADAFRPAGRSATTLSLRAARGGYRMMARPLAIDDQQLTLVGAYSTADIEHALARIRGMFLVAIPTLVLCAAIGGYLLARQSLAPLAEMSARAGRITASSLDQRLPVGGNDELTTLARIFNDLLDRLERAFAQQRRFVADASHELRTPAAILRTESDVTLARQHRSEEEYRASAAVIRDAAGRLSRIVDELFLLARADAGNLVPRREPVYLEDLIHDAVRAVQSLAEQRGVRLELGDLVEAPIEADPDLLGRLLLNLLDNAIKYSPEGGTVTVEMRSQGAAWEVTVADQGPGVPPEARDQIFERFFRVDSARSRAEASATSGAGLGLAIARWIAEMHGGRLALAESRPGRTAFRLTLPAGGPAGP
jgi:heavy metal sensor kinase